MTRDPNTQEVRDPNAQEVRGPNTQEVRDPNTQEAEVKRLLIRRDKTVSKVWENADFLKQRKEN